MADSGRHFVVDGRELVGRMTGVGRNLLEILRCWEPLRQHRFTIVVPAEPVDSVRALRFDWMLEPASVAGTRWEQWSLPRVLRRLRPDALLAPAYTAPLLSPCPTVLTVHDVSFFAHPEWFPGVEGVRRRMITRAAARRASAVITVSEFSRSEIVRYLGIQAAKIVVAPNGPPAVVAAPSTPRSRVVLFVGSLFNRRHIPDMIDAFADVARDVPDARFVLIGDNRTAPRLEPRALAETAGVGHRVEWLDYADEAVVNRLYDSARVFLFLSDYEGFAMTPLEAMAHGVPAVLLDNAVGREIYGGAARLVPAKRVAIAAAVRELLVDDRAHASLVEAGRARLAQFSWQHSADLVLAALEQAAR